MKDNKRTCAVCGEYDIFYAHDGTRCYPHEFHMFQPRRKCEGPALEEFEPGKVHMIPETPPVYAPVNQADAAMERAAKGALGEQVGGDHYKIMGIQPVEYIHANNLGFFEGVVVKYVSRWRRKNGLEDLRKAIHFLQLLIELESKHPTHSVGAKPNDLIPG